MSYATMPARSGSYVYAGFWWRVLAYVIDVAALLLFDVLLGAFLGLAQFRTLMLAGQQDAVVHAFTVLRVSSFVLTAAYYILFECSALRATPGKILCRLAVVDLDGRQIGFWRSVGRYFGKFVSSLILGIGYMMAGWTARKQTLHDKMAGCLVVRKVQGNSSDIRLPEFA